MYPAACQSWVLAVGATDIHNQIPASNPSGRQLDVVAPGGEREDGQPDKGQILSANIAVSPIQASSSMEGDTGPMKRPPMSPGPSGWSCSSNWGSPPRG
jgi:hypothetical protein